jgi:metal-dependent amidase/aminoacylase/carboxypeptidase family protein
LRFDDERFPDMHSDAELVREAIGPIEAAIGEGKALSIHASVPFFGEDFALFQQRTPGAMFFLGVANEKKGITAINHSPDYDIDEAAIEVGTVAMANVLLTYLNRGP